MLTDAVILAAGLSTRANAFKMELKLGDKAVLQHVVEAFLPVCSKIIIVGGYQIERLYPLVEQYEGRVAIIYNRDYEKGMFSSVIKGIQEVRAPQFFLTPGDYPLLTTNICRQLLKYSGQIIKPRYKNQGGHPILLPASCIGELLLEDSDSNLRKYLDKKAIKSIDIEDESVILDLDTPKDYEKLKDRADPI